MKRQRLAVHVEVQRIVHAAVEHIVQNEIHSGQLRQQVTRHSAGFTVGEVGANALLGRLFYQRRVVLGAIGNQADVDLVALVAGARMRQLIERFFLHLFSPLLFG